MHWCKSAAGLEVIFAGDELGQCSAVMWERGDRSVTFDERPILRNRKGAVFESLPSVSAKTGDSIFFTPAQEKRGHAARLCLWRGSIPRYL